MRHNKRRVFGRRRVILACLCFFVFTLSNLGAQDRFPRPEFKSDYTIPTITVPNAPDTVYEYIDLFFLALMLSLVTYLVLKLRLRWAILAATVVSLIYFGFIRRGCICPIGSIQNVTLALADPTYAIPLSVVGFFILPLAFALLFGRTFCAGVCPLGAIQDLVVMKPLRVPAVIGEVLGVIPFIYLGLAVLFTASGIGFIICRFDPFVEIFRLGSRLDALIGGAVILGIGVFIARPYCRFLCPYGALLGLMSRFSHQHAAITPSDCVECRLCEESCPFGAILPGVPESQDEKKRSSAMRIALSLIVFPVLVGAGIFAGGILAPVFGRLSPDVILQEQLRKEEAAGKAGLTEETRLYRETGEAFSLLDARVLKTQQALVVGSPVFGGLLGLVVALRLLGLAVPRTNRDYAIDRAACVSCGRCFEFCPEEKVRRKKKNDNPKKQ
jgi:polyferredoxin